MAEGGVIRTEVLVRRRYTIRVLVRNERRIALDFIDSLARAEQRKVTAFLLRVGEIGAMQARSRPLRGKIFELKPTSQVRLLYFYGEDGSLVITHGFVKKQQKAPRREIERAESLYAEWLAAG